MMLAPATCATFAGAGVAVSETVQLELIRTIGIAIAAVASVTGAVISARERRELRQLRAEHGRRRREVRDPAKEQLIVMDRPPDPPPGGP